MAKSGIRGWVRAGGQRMVAQVEQEGRGCWHRWSRRAEDGDAAGAGGKRMVAQVEQEGRGWWRRWRGGQRMVVQV